MWRILMLLTFLVPYMGHGQSGAVRQHHLTFIPDTTVAGVLLCDTISAIHQFGRIPYEALLPALPQGIPSRVHFQNENKSEVLTLIFHQGGYANEYGEFVISKTARGKIRSTLPLGHFVSGRGIQLGMTEVEVDKLFGEAGKRTVGKETTWEYSLDERDAPAFLTRFGYPRYFATFMFQQGVLVNYHFGFEQP